MDAAKGFGGKFGVADQKDKSALGWDHLEKVEKHTSSKGRNKKFCPKMSICPICKCNPSKSLTSALSVYPPLSPIKILSRNIYCCFVYLSSFVKKHPLFCLYLPLSPPSDYKVGFGGKFGVQTDRQDASAAGWDHVEKVEKHESQVDHKKGFGGKYGVGVQDKSAVGWEHHEILEKHESQKGGLCTSALICLHIFPICFASCACSYFYIFKTTRRGSVANLGFRKIAWMQVQLGGIMWRKSPNTPASKVGVPLHVEKVLKHPSQQGKIPSVVVVVGLEKAPKQDFLSIMHEP